MVVDRFSKYGHFISLKHPFTVKVVAAAFLKEIVRLHGIPLSIVSDRDPIFLSTFWQELFRSAGTKLRMSSAYHPESDGQSEVLNRCLETYLRCFASEHPKSWSQWVAWAEYSYNTSFHSAAGTTPFQVVYGRPPPCLRGFLPGEIRSADLAEDLLERDKILWQLRLHLERAQCRMQTAANKHRREEEFAVGDLVFLKLRNFRQRSVFKGRSGKLAPRYFGPFPVLARVGKVAYRLQLPPEARIHDVFHVSLLKRAIGDEPVSSTLPQDFRATGPYFLPAAILQRRVLVHEGHSIPQLLVRWEGQSEEESTWMEESDFRCQFSFFSLEDKAAPVGEAIDRGESSLKVYKRGPRQVVQYGSSKGKGSAESAY